MTHRELYAEACRKAFEGFQIPDSFWEKRIHQRGGHANQWTKEDGEKLIEYCRQGLRSSDIAPLMGKSPKAIQKAFVRFGFPRLHNICPPSGDHNHAWKGGRHIDHEGYRWVRCQNHPFANANGYVREHRLVFEEHLGRFLLPQEIVHHKDGDRANNDISNLELFSSNGEHLHNTLKGIQHNVSPDGRRRLSEYAKKRWLDPQKAHAMKTNRDIAAISEKSRKLWSDPTWKAKTLAAQKQGRDLLKKARQETSIRKES